MVQIFQSEAGCENWDTGRGHSKRRHNPGKVQGAWKQGGEGQFSCSICCVTSPGVERTLCCKALGGQHNHGHASTTVQSLSTGQDSREDGRRGGEGAQQQPGWWTGWNPGFPVRMGKRGHETCGFHCPDCTLWNCAKLKDYDRNRWS